MERFSTECASDFNHFAQNYLKIVHYEKGLIPFNPYPFQQRLVKHYEKNLFTILKKFRFSGFSTTTLLWLLWRMMFKAVESAYYFTKTDKEAIYSSSIVRKAIDSLPDWLKPKMEICNDHRITFEESGGDIGFYKLEAMKAKNVKWLVIEEAAFIENMDLHWKAVYPVVSTGGSVIVMSTPNGNKGWFYETYKQAEEKMNNFSIFKSDYTENPEFDNKEFQDKIKNNLGEKGFDKNICRSF